MSEQNKTATTGNSDGNIVGLLKDTLEKIDKNNQLLQGDFLAQLSQENALNYWNLGF